MNMFGVWLSQFLLKGFGIVNRSTYVYELDKLTGAITTREISKAASKQQLLTEADDKIMQRVESSAARAVQKIKKECRRGRRLELSEDERLALDSVKGGGKDLLKK